MGYLEEQTAKIKSQYDADLAKRIQAINNQTNETISGYNKQFEDKAKEYKTQSVGVDTQAAINRKNNNELMAAIGAYNSGDNITANARINTDRANSLQSILNSKNDYRKLIDGNIAKARQAAEYQINDTRNTLTSNMNDRLLQLQEAERQREFQAAEAEKQRQAQLALQREQIAAQRRSAQAAAQKSSKGSFNDFYAQFKDLTRGNPRNQSEARNLIEKGKDDLIKNYGYSNYKKLYNWYWTGQAPEYSYNSMKDSDLLDFSIN